MAHHTSRVVTSILIVTSCASLASAQIVTGVPGSPSATTTIDGKQLPPPPTKFGGAGPIRMGKKEPHEGV